MLASAHHFPVPHFGTAAQTFWLSSPLEPSVRPPGFLDGLSSRSPSFLLWGKQEFVQANKHLAFGARFPVPFFSPFNSINIYGESH